MADELKVVGERVPRWQAEAKATGAAKYTIDVKITGMLVGKVLRSPYAHARIVKIDKSEAEKLAGVEAVISFDDIPKKLYTPSKSGLTYYHPENEVADMYVLSDKARFAGDAIAAVAAVDALTAQEALKLIKVEYDILPAVFDPVEAMKPGAPVVHDFARNNIARHLTFAAARGDIKKGLQESDAVTELNICTSRQQMCQFEPSTCVASVDSTGRLTIWSLSQHVYNHRIRIADIFGIPYGKIRWITLHVGGGWGKFGSLSGEPICVALALKTRKPVKLEYSREEDFLESTRQTYVEMGKIGVKKDGTINALQAKLLAHGGAYFTHNASTTNVGMGTFTGLYRCPNVAAEADTVYTNLQPTGGVRGYGNSEAAYLLEQLVDIAAEKIGMDPVELRLRNMKKVGDPSNAGMPMETFALDKVIKIGAERFKWQEKRARRRDTGVKRRGIGMACMMHVSGAQPHQTQHRNALIKMNEDGSANLIISSCDMGQNLLGTCAQIAAEVLSLNYEDIHVISGDTDFALYDQGQHASGGLYQVGNAVLKAAQDTRRQLLERAGKTLGVPPVDLDIKERRIFRKSDPAQGITVKDLCWEAIYNFKNQHDHFLGRGSFSPILNPPPFGAAFVEVEVDTETGVVDLKKVLFVNDVGKAINPTTVEGQIQGGISQAVGLVLTEDYFINARGVVESDNFSTYKIPSALDMPEIELLIYEQDPVPSGPFGAKGVGENPIIPVAPAIANAIYDAVGVRITEVPITPEKIIKALIK